MRKREQVNIEWTGSDRIKGIKQEDNSTSELDNIQEYLEKEGYNKDQFDPQKMYMKNQTNKINVVRDGKETKLNVYGRK